MKRTAARDETEAGWRPEVGLHGLLLEAVLDKNPLPAAYRISYVANFYVGPLVKWMEASFGITRAEWIVLFCLSQSSRLNAMQISTVTGRPKTSVALAVQQLQRKKLIIRRKDALDARCRVLQLTDDGRSMYRKILARFMKRERDILDCLTPAERKELLRLFDKVIENGSKWAVAF